MGLTEQKQESDMAKNIVICTDGTCNEYGATSMNVARVFAALNRSDPTRQVAAYFPGIGTIPSPSALTAVSRLTTKLASLCDRIRRREHHGRTATHRGDHQRAWAAVRDVLHQLHRARERQHGCCGVPTRVAPHQPAGRHDFLRVRVPVPVAS